MPTLLMSLFFSQLFAAPRKCLQTALHRCDWGWETLADPTQSRDWALEAALADGAATVPRRAIDALSRSTSGCSVLHRACVAVGESRRLLGPVKGGAVRRGRAVAETEHLGPVIEGDREGDGAGNERVWVGACHCGRGSPGLFRRRARKG